MKPVLVNPHHVKKSKEFDNNNPTKNDCKDPKVIAWLVREGRYTIPYLPDGAYADLRTAPNMRFQLQMNLQEFRIGSVVGSTYIFLNTKYKTVSGFLAEVGYISRFNSLKELHKLVDWYW